MHYDLVSPNNKKTMKYVCGIIHISNTQQIGNEGNSYNR